MALIDKIQTPPNKGKGISLIDIHLFTATMNLWSLGIITRNQVITVLGLETTDENQLDKLATHYTNLPANEKSEFYGKLESLGILLERGHITKTQFVSLLGL